VAAQAGNTFRQWSSTRLKISSNWTAGDPIGAAYDVTDNGWFDARTFKIWFSTVFLANIASRPGIKLLMGDNLPSHFSPIVIEEA